MLLAFLISLQQTGFFSAIRDSAYAYPAILALHIVALAFFGGMVVVTNLRVLGLGMRSYSIEEVVSGLRGPKHFGFTIAALTGALLFGAKAGQYANAPWFWVKLLLLALAGANGLMLGRTKMAAGVSLLLWTGVICAARGPATIKDIMHSMVDPNGDFLFKSVQKIADDRGSRIKAPRTDAEWEDVRQHLLVLERAPDLLIEPGRRAARPRDRSANPQVENEPVDAQRALDADRAGFFRRARRLHDAAAVAMKAVDAKDTEALFRSLDGIDKACESCHLHYWYPRDKRAQEAAKEDGITD